MSSTIKRATDRPVETCMVAQLCIGLTLHMWFTASQSALEYFLESQGKLAALGQFCKQGQSS